MSEISFLWELSLSISCKNVKFLKKIYHIVSGDFFLQCFFILQKRAAWPFCKTSPFVFHRTKSFETETKINSCCGCKKYITVLLSVLKKCLEHFCSPDNWLSVKNRQTPPMSRNAPAKAGIMLTCVKIWPRRDQRSEFNEDHHDG